ncbi:16S rRNA (cytosine(1402)-N(4))-methyltransferase [Candidatus Peregrinibacteria bacterium CG1_02_54_53]|nr:MAG: 16S rRNA (cytosine(1402)-N(4))-methyltransferase [Candidatus Peregrinibacteria bacterium CG1_02_54_53]
MSLPHHTPVLLQEVLTILDPRAGETVLDVTLGLGGHAEAFLKLVGVNGVLIGLDADVQNLRLAESKLHALSGRADCRHANFSAIADLDLPPIDILFADLGLSSPHVDDPARGFTFREEVPLDLRYDRTNGVSAAAWLAQVPEEEVARCLHEFGELPSSKRFARVLKERKPTTTTAVVLAAESVYRWRAKAVLPQIFQALRIAVNDELGALETLLHEGPSLLRPGGRMGVISYHSLEDRRVKQTFRVLSQAPKHPETGQNVHPPFFTLLTRKAIVPSEDEVTLNPRSRSAKLRAIMRSVSTPS